MREKPAHRVEILAFAKGQILDVTGPAQVFATANDLTPPSMPRPYEVALVSLEPDVVTSSGVVLKPEAAACQSSLGTLIVSGGYGVDAARRNKVLIDWIRRRASMAERTASVCSGAFLLAEAGLLDGRRAVTHWQRCAEFQGRYPAVRLDPDPIFVRDGEIWTSAGVTAGIDLALAMVEEDLGRPLALAVARQLVVFLKRRAYDSSVGPNFRGAACLDRHSSRRRLGAHHTGRARRHEPSHVLSPLSARDGSHAERRGRAHPFGKGPTAFGGGCERDTNSHPLRLPLHGNDATGIPTPFGRRPERLP